MEKFRKNSKEGFTKDLNLLFGVMPFTSILVGEVLNFHCCFNRYNRSYCTFTMSKIDAIAKKKSKSEPGVPTQSRALKILEFVDGYRL